MPTIIYYDKKFTKQHSLTSIRRYIVGKTLWGCCFCLKITAMQKITIYNDDGSITEEVTLEEDREREEIEDCR